MQKTRFSLLVIVGLLLCIGNTACMEVVRKNEMLVPSLKKLCMNTIAASIQENNIDKMISQNSIKDFSCIPQELNKKIMGNIFCYKFGHKYPYKESSPFDYHVLLDENNNQLFFKDEKNALLTAFTMDGEKIESFPLQKGDYCYRGSLIALKDFNKKALNIVKDGKIKTINDVFPSKYCNLEKILKNRQELIFRKDGQYSLFNFNQEEIIYNNVQSIQFDDSEKICMIKSGNTVIISTPKLDNVILTRKTLSAPHREEIEIIEEFRTKYEKQIELQNVENAFLSPNGKQLLINRKDNSVELIRIKGEKTICSLEGFTGLYNSRDVKFNPDGNYMVLYQYSIQEGHVHHIVDTKKGEICVRLQVPMHKKLIFDDKYLIFGKKYLVLQKDSQQVCVMHVKNLEKLDNFSKDMYTVEDILKLGLGKTFNNFEGFHPSGKYIILRPNYQWQLVEPKSGKSIFTVNHVIHHSFSEPAGKMLYLGDAWYKGHQVISLRNDFTIEEYLLNRFMIEKNLTESDLSYYPHMQKIYNNMDKDKQLFYCLDTGKVRTQTNSFSKACVIS